jgi:hypothetical protein
MSTCCQLLPKTAKMNCGTRATATLPKPLKGLAVAVGQRFRQLPPNRAASDNYGSRCRKFIARSFP